LFAVEQKFALLAIGKINNFEVSHQKPMASESTKCCGFLYDHLKINHKKEENKTMQRPYDEQTPGIAHFPTF
jgi:hypothetical protein